MTPTVEQLRHLRSWHPTPDEVQRIVLEMRPIIQDFARRAREAQQGDPRA